ncbi:MAG TPA: co-chaperone DjlA [Steroidobacteraceae bacterium]|nr:co-chaperone DjlA [Steroidobacteraceae bacterium]
MNWGGKLIGGTLGMLALGPIGAAIGVFIGHQFDSGAAQSNLLGGGLFGTGTDPRQVNQLFFPTTFRIMGHIAKADGRVSEQEVASARAVMQALHLQDAQIQTAIAHFTEGKQPGFDADGALKGLRVALAGYPELAYFFVEIQLQAALAGNGLPPLLRARLKRLAGLLGVGAADFDRLESVLRFRMRAGAAGYGGAHFRAGAAGTTGSAGGAGYGYGPGRYGESISDEQHLAHAYSVLAARAGMSDEEVVKCYRRQMSRHHPDKLKANGLPDSMLERAKEEAQEIQAAYELIRARRGMR